MRIWISALALLGAASVASCGTSGSGRDADADEPIRVLLSTDALMFSDFDADRDYNVSNAEIEAGITGEFARADTNHDNQIGPIEFQSWSAQVLGGSLTGPFRLDFDRNVDNQISADEFRTEILARAHAYDADENGSISRAELVRDLHRARPHPPRLDPNAATRR